MCVQGDNGAALHFEAVSSASLTASELRDNRAFLSGGAVYIIHSGPTVVLNTSLLNNTARLGGAVFADNAALELLACTASGNQAVPAVRGGRLLHGVRRHLPQTAVSLDMLHILCCAGIPPL